MSIRPSSNAQDDHDDHDHQRRLYRFLTRRPHDLAQLEIRFDQEIAQRLPGAREKSDRTGEHQAAQQDATGAATWPGRCTSNSRRCRRQGPATPASSFAMSAAELPPTCSAFAFIDRLCQILRGNSPVTRTFNWHARRDLNPQPAVLETAALPIELLACVTSSRRRRLAKCLRALDPDQRTSLYCP